MTLARAMIAISGGMPPDLEMSACVARGQGSWDFAVVKNVGVALANLSGHIAGGNGENSMSCLALYFFRWVAQPSDQLRNPTSFCNRQLVD